MNGRRLLAVFALVILAITETAPHRHGDTPVQFSDVLGATEIRDVRCSAPNDGVRHLHRVSSRPIDVCIACVRQHLQATSSHAVQSSPQRVAQPIAAVHGPINVAAPVRTLPSRAPPVLG